MTRDVSPLMVALWTVALLCALGLTIEYGRWGMVFVILAGLLLAKALVGKPIGAAAKG